MSSRRVVILTPGGRFVEDVLALLAERGTVVHAVVLYLPPPPAARGEMRGMARARHHAFRPLRWVRRRIAQRLRMRRMRGVPVVRTGELNGRRMTDDLRRLDPDVVLLAHCGLVAPDVLAVPREGAVNVHPGLLPWIRGSSPIANSLLRGVPLGASAFRVDAGIDTGAVLARRLVSLAGSETVSDVRDALHRLWVEMTADLVAAVSAAPLPPGTPQGDRFPLCRTMEAPPQRAAMAAAIARGEAKALFDRWAPHCDPSTHALPADADALPAVHVAV